MSERLSDDGRVVPSVSASNSVSNSTTDSAGVLGRDGPTTFEVPDSFEGSRADYLRSLEVASRAAELHLTPDDLEVFLKHGFTFDTVPKLNGPVRKNMLAYLKKKEEHPPKWLIISGLYPHFLPEEKERRQRLRALYKAAVLLIRRALARKEVDPDRAERGIFWDPVAEVCRDLEIAQSKLSALLKEFSGNSLTQVIDCVRVERVRKLMRREIRGFVRAQRATSGTITSSHEGTKDTKIHKEGGEEKLDRWAVWGKLKDSRKWPEFSQNTWAMGLGFSSYRRLYRACLCVYGQTPHQMEMGIIEEELKRGDSEVWEEEKEISVEEAEALVRTVRPYPEWEPRTHGNGG